MKISSNQIWFMTGMAFILGYGALVATPESKRYELIELREDGGEIHEYVQDHDLSSTDCEGFAEARSLIGGVWECRLEEK